MMCKRKYKILLVDDDPHMLKLNNDLLESEGYKVTTAMCGNSAIEAMEKDAFDVVVTDLFMGKANGFAVLKRAKELDPNIIVMIITGSFDVRNAIEAIRLDADDYLLKSFREDDMVQRVAHWLERRALKQKNMHSAA